MAAVDLLFADSPASSDCLQAEKLCLEDEPCNSSYHDLRHCSHVSTAEPVNKTRCLQAEVALKQYPLVGCKCKRRMKREEHCLNVYWAVNPVNVQGFRDLGDSPYDDIDVDMTTEFLDMEKLLTAQEKKIESTNDCVHQTNMCSFNEKCSKHKNAYVLQCRETNHGETCERRKCHQLLRQFFKKIPVEFTKRMLFCQCHDNKCGERRRKTIVPECSFEEASKPNCLQLHYSCINDNLCKSRLADFQKHCHPFDKRTTSCPSDDLCLQAYIRMIGTIMTPNFITNSSMALSLWCTCESSGNQNDDCKAINGMFAGSTCLRNLIKSEFGGNIELDTTLTISRIEHTDDTNFSALSRTNKVSEKNQLPNNSENQEKDIPNQPSGTGTSVSFSALALTLFSSASLWILDMVFFI
ncbi:GDNF family receptor alpha-3 [Pelobates cultripes]|uniref:GDNF family receptor alpha-3 n=1 Tax=Pelobates cultripes TaxID=61616 RepID=A0AAD1RS00_PELCU|nr:GDNF family receptor alpha-3 [Pelobates cultripes]